MAEVISTPILRTAMHQPSSHSKRRGERDCRYREAKTATRIDSSTKVGMR
jgi:hypothetical protein